MYIQTADIGNIGAVNLSTAGTELKIYIHLSGGGMIALTVDEFKELTEKVMPLIAKAEAIKKTLAEFDEISAPDSVVDSEDTCEASWNDWHCTRPLNHKGNHGAWGTAGNEPFVRWSQEAER